MKQVIELLNRWYKRFTNSSNDIDIVPMSIDTVDTAIRCVYDYVSEAQKINDDHILTNIDALLKNIVMTGGFVGLAYSKDRVVGCICVMISMPEVWDSRRTATVSNLYVKPEYRNNPKILMGLIRSGTTFLLSQDVEIVRISCESEQLRDKYIKLFGFKPVYYQTILEVKG